MKTAAAIRIILVGILTISFGLWAYPADAGVTVAFDMDTLNELLPSLTANRIEVPLADGEPLTVLVQDVRVTGLSPARTPEASDQILTTMRLRVPKFGLDVPVKAHLILTIVKEGDQNALELSFGKVLLPLPLVGSINVAKFIPPFRFPADNAWLTNGVQGNVYVNSRLAEIRMGQEVIRFEFDLDVASVAGTRPGR